MRFSGSIFVVLIVFLLTYLWGVFSKWHPRRDSVEFEVTSIHPTNPQDYILLGQKIDINEAGVELFETLPGIGPSLAERIVNYRRINGIFANVGELEKVKGIGTKTVERLRQYVK